MSNLYGTLGGDGRAQQRTRCARHETFAAAQSWHGSVTVTLYHDGVDACIQVRDGSGVGGRELWSGPLADLLRSGAHFVLVVGERAPEPEPEDEAPSLDPDNLPPCAQAMGCLCAAHAKGRKPEGPCDADVDVDPARW